MTDDSSIKNDDGVVDTRFERGRPGLSNLPGVSQADHRWLVSGPPTRKTGRPWRALAAHSCPCHIHLRTIQVYRLLMIVV